MPENRQLLLTTVCFTCYTRKLRFISFWFTYLWIYTYFTNRIFLKDAWLWSSLSLLFATYHHQEIYLSIVMAFPIIFGGFGCQCQSSSFLAKLFFSTMCYKIFYVNCVCLLSACCYIQSSLWGLVCDNHFLKKYFQVVPSIYN